MPPSGSDITAATDLAGIRLLGGIESVRRNEVIGQEREMSYA
jgi:hypothetical protein